jgi:hypothetical protein
MKMATKPTKPRRREGFCIYCGFSFLIPSNEPEDMARVYEVLIAHDKECPKNPFVVEIARLRAELGRANMEIDGLKGLLDHRQEVMELQG